MQKSVPKIFVAAAIILTLQASAQNQRRIVWEKDRPLTWSDFRGAPHDSSFAAATYCSIEVAVCRRNFWTGRMSIKVEATVFPDTSWYQIEKIHELALRHEQGHFDIVEWHSRKLRKLIDEEIRNVNEFNVKFKTLYQNLHSEYYAEQLRYEKETDYGTSRDGQLRWEHKIAGELLSYERFNGNGCRNVGRRKR